MNSRGNSGRAVLVCLGIIVLLAAVGFALSWVARGWMIGSLSPSPHPLVVGDWHFRVVLIYILAGAIMGIMTTIFIGLFKGGSQRNVRMYPKFWAYVFWAMVINLIFAFVFVFIITGTADNVFFFTRFFGQHLLLMLSILPLQLFIKWFLFKQNYGRTLVN